jgi:hypothetical protein
MNSLCSSPRWSSEELSEKSVHFFILAPLRYSPIPLKGCGRFRARTVGQGRLCLQIEVTQCPDLPHYTGQVFHVPGTCAERIEKLPTTADTDFFFLDPAYHQYVKMRRAESSPDQQDKELIS